VLDNASNRRTSNPNLTLLLNKPLHPLGIPEAQGSKDDRWLAFSLQRDRGYAEPVGVNDDFTQFSAIHSLPEVGEGP
jgi:hypothetical protein